MFKNDLIYQKYDEKSKEEKNLQSVVDFQNFISRKRFELFTTFLINLQNPRWPFFHLTDDLEGNGISSEGFLKWGKV
jgi:hypothetical protein